MNSHEHARLTYARRLEMVQQMTKMGGSTGEVAAAHSVTPATARKWLAIVASTLRSVCDPEESSECSPILGTSVQSGSRSTACAWRDSGSLRLTEASCSARSLLWWRSLLGHISSRLRWHSAPSHSEPCQGRAAPGAANP
jgi:hypothetical protein